jgi:sulfate adenylyltransferase
LSETDTALKLTLSGRQTADFELLANGGFAPLEGFMGSDDWRSVVENMTLADGEEVWPIPVVLASDLECSEGDVIELEASNGKALGRITVSEVFERDVEREAEQVYRTTDDEHPGVAAIREEGNRCIAGKIEADAAPDHEEAFMRRYLTPAESKAEFEKRGWKRIVAFQTRNPIHRAHEYLTKAALEVSDGLFLHPLIGETKKGDIPADVRMRCYEILMEKYYPDERVVLGVNPAAMRYAGPREAIFHAIVRRNYGATHFIVGRDHAGVGDYYGTYDAQEIFDEVDLDKLGIEPLKFEHTFWCNECEGMGSGKTCPHDQESRLFLSGTKVREMLEAGEKPPHEFTREEVADILIDAYAKETE